MARSIGTVQPSGSPDLVRTARLTPMKTEKKKLRRLMQTAMFAAVRGAADAAGSAAVAGAVWWLSHR